MNGIQGSTAAMQADGIIKDVTSAQLITKTLDRMNTSQALSGPAVDAGYQFRKDVLSAAGIGNALNSVV